MAKGRSVPLPLGFQSGALIGYEAELWEVANALRGSMDAAGYKHVVLGLVFLKYISDAFEECRKLLEQEPYADPEDPDEYRAKNVFWVPSEARWKYLEEKAREPEISGSENHAYPQAR